MRWVRKILLALHALTLTLAVFLCGWGLAYTAWLLGSEPVLSAVQRTITSLVLLVLTGAYATILLRVGFSLRAWPSYLLSLILVGGVLHAFIRAAGKTFAPAADADVSVGYVIGTGELALAFAAAVIVCVSAWRSARRAEQPERSRR
jgi:hypothetical protein